MSSMGENSGGVTGVIAAAVLAIVVTAGSYIASAAWQIPYTSAAQTRAAILTYPIYLGAPQSLPFVIDKVSPGNFGYHPQILPYTRTRAAAVWIPSLALAAGAIWFVGLGGGPNVSREGRYLRGRRLHRGKESIREFKKSMANSCAQDGTGLQVIDAAPFSLELECRHSFVVGGVGSGKTVFLTRQINAARARGDRLLVHDAKGDFTSKQPGPFILLAPHDRRSAVWDVADDVRTESDAMELASRLIKEGRDPFWAQAAQALMIGWTLYLMRERGRDWGWTDLAKMAESSREELMKIMEKHYPAATSYVDEQNAMTSSVIASLKAPLMFIRQLGHAWPSTDGRPKFSFRRWLTTDTANERLVIFQSAQHLPRLSAGWINAAFELSANMAMSPLLADNPRDAPLEEQRRIWFVLDELPALKKLPSFESVISQGRSKGLRVLAAVQSWEQLLEVYGQNVANAWMSMTGTLVALYSKGKSADKLSELFGNAEFEVIRKAQTISADKRVSSNFSPNLEQRRVLLPTDFEKLGKTQMSDGSGAGIRGFLLINGDGFEIEYAFVPEHFYREAALPAPWTIELEKEERA